MYDIPWYRCTMVPMCLRSGIPWYQGTGRRPTVARLAVLFRSVGAADQSLFAKVEPPVPPRPPPPPSGWSGAPGGVSRAPRMTSVVLPLQPLQPTTLVLLPLQPLQPTAARLLRQPQPTVPQPARLCCCGYYRTTATANPTSAPGNCLS